MYGLYKEALPDGMVFGIASALKKVYNFTLVHPKLGLIMSLIWVMVAQLLSSNMVLTVLSNLRLNMSANI